MIWGGAEAVMLVLGSGCKYRLSLAERFDCRDHNKSIACRFITKPYQWVASENKLKAPLILHYGELYNYFIIYYNVKIIEIKCTIDVMRLNQPETTPFPNPPWKNCLPRNQSLVPKRLGTVGLRHYQHFWAVLLQQPPNQSLCLHSSCSTVCLCQSNYNVPHRAEIR